MPQNNYNKVIEGFNDYSKNISIEKFMKNVDEIEQLLKTSENDLGFNTVEQLKDNIVNDELKSN